MRKLYIFLISCMPMCRTIAQHNVIDSLKQNLHKERVDSAVFTSLMQIGELYTFNNADSANQFINSASALALRHQNALWKAHVNYSFSLYYYVLNDYAAALNYALKSINGFEHHQDSFLYALGTHMLASLYEENKLSAEARGY